MPTTERITAAVPPEIAAAIREAVQHGDYASAGDVVRSALEEWAKKRAGEAATLRDDVASGLADIDAHRVVDFDIERIVERGRRLSAGR